MTALQSKQINSMRPILFLNFALPLAYGIGLLLGIYIYMAIAEILVSAGIEERIAIPIGGWSALLLVIGAAILLVKVKVKVFEASTGKTALGHSMLALGNIAIIATTILPLAYAYLSGRSENGLYMWFALPVLLMNLLLWPLGWKFATSASTDTSKP